MNSLGSEEISARSLSWLILLTLEAVAPAREAAAGVIIVSDASPPKPADDPPLPR
jgi:hypothetical protein